METINYKFVEEYTKFPGGRFVRLGPYSGEDFREKVLRPIFESDKKIVIDATGVVTSFSPSFLDEAFGELAKEYGLKSFNNAKLAKNIDVQISISKTLSLILEQLKDYKQALFFKNYYNHINDSISAINSERIITEMQTKYETAKKIIKLKSLK